MKARIAAIANGLVLCASTTYCLQPGYVLADEATVGQGEPAAILRIENPLRIHELARELPVVESRHPAPRLIENRSVMRKLLPEENLPPRHALRSSGSDGISVTLPGSQPMPRSKCEQPTLSVGRSNLIWRMFGRRRSPNCEQVTLTAPESQFPQLLADQMEFPSLPQTLTSSLGEPTSDAVGSTSSIRLVAANSPRSAHPLSREAAGDGSVRQVNEDRGAGGAGVKTAAGESLPTKNTATTIPPVSDAAAKPLTPASSLPSLDDDDDETFPAKKAIKPIPSDGNSAPKDQLKKTQARTDVALDDELDNLFPEGAESDVDRRLFDKKKPTADRPMNFSPFSGIRLDPMPSLPSSDVISAPPAGGTPNVAEEKETHKAPGSPNPLAADNAPKTVPTPTATSAAPATKTPTVQQPKAQQPIAQQPTVEQPIAKQPATRQPEGKTPAPRSEPLPFGGDQAPLREIGKSPEPTPAKPKPTEPQPELADDDDDAGRARLEKKPLPADSDDGLDSRFRRIAARKTLKGYKGFCPVALRKNRDLEDSHADYYSTFQGRQYFFSSEEAKEEFDNDPTPYVPVEGGLDVVMLKNDKGRVEGSLEFAVWYKDRLYFFASAASMDEFGGNPAKYVPKN